MSAQQSHDPYEAVIRRFNRSGVRYIVVGMSGINYYAKSPRESFGTMDYDFFVEPTLKNVEKAVRCLKAMGFDLTGEWDLRQTVRDQRTLTATTANGLMVELLLKISGYPFSGLAKDAVTFSVRGVPVKVGQIRKLLRSKKLAGRPKDRRFLRRYQDLLEE